MVAFGNVQLQVGNLWVRDRHLEALLVNDGDQVAPGTVLGLEGLTGISTGRPCTSRSIARARR